jgi:hypothetical protein
MDVVNGAATQGDSHDAVAPQVAKPEETGETSEIVVTEDVVKDDSHDNYIDELELLPLPKIPVDGDRRKNGLCTREFIVDQPVSYMFFYLFEYLLNLFIFFTEFGYHGNGYYSNWMLCSCWLW